MVQSLRSLLQEVGLTPPPRLADAQITAIRCDSRRIEAGCLFVGLAGSRVDGGSFWPQALSCGASLALIGAAAASLRPPGDEDAVLVVPTDRLNQLAGELAAAFWQHPSRRLELCGVTGTNGKTTTTHLIEHLAGCSGRPAALFGTLVNRWPGHSAAAQHTTGFADGLQEQLARAVSAGAQVAAMEVSSHALDQQRVAGCRFAGAVFTNLSQDHLDYHPSMEAYFQAKARLFSPELLQGGAVVNGDDPRGSQLARQLSGAGLLCWRSSLQDPGAELHIRDLVMEAEGVSGILETPVGGGPFRAPLVGRFNLMNLLQAVGILAQRQLPLPSLLQGLASFRGVPGRMERVDIASSDPLPAVLVDYAHTPDGLENALIACRPFTSGRLICVFGCGGDRDRGKRPQMGEIAARLADRVMLTSDNPRTEDPERILADVQAGIPAGAALTVRADRAEAIAEAIAEAAADDLVLIAGKGHEDYQILASGRIHFDDREQARRALQARVGGIG